MHALSRRLADGERFQIQLQNRGDSFVSLGRRSLAFRELGRLRKPCVARNFRIHHIPSMDRYSLNCHILILEQRRAQWTRL